jgi:hypothetical protein
VSKLSRGPASLLALACALTPGCRVRESREAAFARVNKAYLASQVAGLEALIAKADKGGLETASQIAVSLDESTARNLLNAPLPQEKVIAGRIRVSVVHAEPFFRGSQGALLFRARASSDRLPGHYAELEFAGGLEEMKLENGRLSARPRLLHFSIVQASAGPLAQAALESLVRENLDDIQGLIPALEVPVRLEERVSIPGFEEGPVSVKGGSVTVQGKISHVLYAEQRLWVLLDVGVGAWETTAE